MHGNAFKEQKGMEFLIHTVATQKELSRQIFYFPHPNQTKHTEKASPGIQYLSNKVICLQGNNIIEIVFKWLFFFIKYSLLAKLGKLNK